MARPATEFEVVLNAARRDLDADTDLDPHVIVDGDLDPDGREQEPSPVQPGKPPSIYTPQTLKHAVTENRPLDLHQAADTSALRDPDPWSQVLWDSAAAAPVWEQKPLQVYVTRPSFNSSDLPDMSVFMSVPQTIHVCTSD